MFVSSGTDQLHIDVHRIGNFLHTAFEQVGDPKLLPDFTQIVGRTLVFLRRTTRNNLKRRDLGEARQNLVLNSFREVGIGFIVAQIIEWEHSNAFGRDFHDENRQRKQD